MADWHCRIPQVDAAWEMLPGGRLKPVAWPPAGDGPASESLATALAAQMGP